MNNTTAVEVIEAIWSSDPEVAVILDRYVKQQIESYIEANSIGVHVSESFTKV